MADDQVPVSVSVEAPRGTHQARCDEKGRLKLPAVFLQYLAALKEQKVFITSLDRRTARIYPISIWKHNEIVMEQAGDDAKKAAHLSRIANHFGDDSEIDGQGRVLVPTNLRRHLAIENQHVWLDCFNGRINVYSDAEYQKLLDEAFVDLDGDYAAMEKRGLK